MKLAFDSGAEIQAGQEFLVAPIGTFVPVAGFLHKVVIDSDSQVVVDDIRLNDKSLLMGGGAIPSEAFALSTPMVRLKYEVKAGDRLVLKVTGVRPSRLLGFFEIEEG